MGRTDDGQTEVVLTVAQIAELVVPPGAGKSAMIERLRAWADAGLLQPTGELNPGTGRHRVFLDSNVLLAAILNALADAGVTVGKLRSITEQVRKRWRPCKRSVLQRHLAHHKARPGGGVFLEIDQSKPEVFVHTGIVRNFCSRADCSLVIDVGKLSARIEARKTEQSTTRGKNRGRERTKSP